MPDKKREIRYGGAMMGSEEIAAVTRVMQKEHGLQVGENVLEFEKQIAALMGKRYGAMVNSGSSALMLAMRLLQLPAGSEVLTPVLTFSTDVASIVHAGYTPVFVDVEADTYQIDCDAIEAMIGERTRAMLVPNLIGGMPQWERLREIADRHSLLLVEDSADTLGGSYKGSPPGIHADISLTSFSIFHIMTCLGNGGMVCVDNPELWDRALMLRCWGRSSEKFLYGSRQKDSDGRFLEDLGDIPYDGMFLFEDLAYGFIPNEAGAAFGLEQIKKLDLFTKLRSQIFDSHSEFLGKHEDIFLRPRLFDGVQTTWICYPIQLRPELGWSRRALQVHLEDAGIFTRVIFSGNITRQPMMQGQKYRAPEAGCPAADQVMKHGLMLPCHPTMSEEDCSYLYETLQEFIDAQSA